MQLRSRDDLTRLMKLKGYNDRTLADAADLHHSTVHRLRTGQRPHCYIDTAAAIADALGVRLEALFRPAEQNNPSEFASPIH